MVGSRPTNESGKQWYAVTFRGPAEMTVWVEAESAREARQRADDTEYDDATDVEFLHDKPYTMKVRRAPDYRPPEDWER